MLENGWLEFGAIEREGTVSFYVFLGAGGISGGFSGGVRMIRIVFVGRL